MSKKSKNKNTQKPKNNNQAVKATPSNTRVDKLKTVFNSLLDIVKLQPHITSKDIELFEKLFNSFPTFYADIVKDGNIRTGKIGLSISSPNMRKQTINYENAKLIYDKLLIALRLHIEDAFNKHHNSKGKISIGGTPITYFTYCCETDGDLVKEFVEKYINESISEYEESHYEMMIKLIYKHHLKD